MSRWINVQSKAAKRCCVAGNGAACITNAGADTEAPTSQSGICLAARQEDDQKEIGSGIESCDNRADAGHGSVTCSEGMAGSVETMEPRNWPTARPSNFSSVRSLTECSSIISASTAPVSTRPILNQSPTTRTCGESRSGIGASGRLAKRAYTLTPRIGSWNALPARHAVLSASEMPGADTKPSITEVAAEQVA